MHVRVQVWRYLTTYWGERTTTTAAADSAAASPQSQLGREDSGGKEEKAGAVGWRAMGGDSATHADLTHLEALLLRAVNLHAQRLLAGGNEKDGYAAADAAGASAVHAAYVEFFREMQGFTR